MKKAIIGISSSLMIDESDGFQGYELNYISKDYVNAVIKAGAIPIIIPFNEDKEVTKEYINLIDGLLISGGHDVNPYLYNQEPHHMLGETFPQRDEYETILILEAKKRNIPILGICRGLQLINVIEGGTLYQDTSLIKDSIKHDQKSNPSLKTHKITVDKNSILYVEEDTMVNSFHHQAIDKIAPNYEIIAKANDGVIEAIINKNYDFLLAVQWHPEMIYDNSIISKHIFDIFIQKALEKKDNL